MPSLTCHSVCTSSKNRHPLLEVAEHRDAGRYYSIIHEYPYTLNQTSKILADRTRHIQPNPHGDSDWPKLTPHLRREPKAIGW